MMNAIEKFNIVVSETSENGNSDGSTDTSDKTESSDSTASDDIVSDDPTDYEKDEIDENTIGVVASKVEATAGGYITVPVKLTSNPGFVAMLFNVEYDPAVLEFTTCDDGDIITGAQLNTENKGTIAVLWDDANNADMAKTGTLLNLKFKVIGKAGANSEIKLSVPKDGGFVSFEKVNYVSYALVSGSVTVK